MKKPRPVATLHFSLLPLPSLEPKLLIGSLAMTVTAPWALTIAHARVLSPPRSGGQESIAGWTLLPVSSSLVCELIGRAAENGADPPSSTRKGGRFFGPRPLIGLRSLSFQGLPRADWLSEGKWAEIAFQSGAQLRRTPLTEAGGGGRSSGLPPATTLGRWGGPPGLGAEVKRDETERRKGGALAEGAGLE